MCIRDRWYTEALKGPSVMKLWEWCILKSGIIVLKAVKHQLRATNGLAGPQPKSRNNQESSSTSDGSQCNLFWMTVTMNHAPCCCKICTKTTHSWSKEKSSVCCMWRAECNNSDCDFLKKIITRDKMYDYDPDIRTQSSQQSPQPKNCLLYTSRCV